MKIFLNKLKTSPIKGQNIAKFAKKANIDTIKRELWLNLENDIEYEECLLKLIERPTNFI